MPGISSLWHSIHLYSFIISVLENTATIFIPGTVQSQTCCSPWHNVILHSYTASIVDNTANIIIPQTAQSLSVTQSTVAIHTHPKVKGKMSESGTFVYLKFKLEICIHLPTHILFFLYSTSEVGGLQQNVLNLSCPDKSKVVPGNPKLKAKNPKLDAKHSKLDAQNPN